jgi:tetratricopeptide (TPR) repeat protein
VRSLRFVCVLCVLAGLASPPAPVEAQTGRVAGTIKDDRGEPVRGAVVVADNPFGAPSTASGLSDDKGRFSILGLRGGVWTLSIRAPGFEVVKLAYRVQALRPNPPLAVTLTRAAVTPAGPLKDVDVASLMADLDRASRLEREGKHTEATAIYRTAARRAPSLTSLNLAIGRSCRAGGDLLCAREALATLVSLEPDNVAARLELGLVHEAAGDSAAAAREFEEIIRRAPDSATARQAREKLSAPR